MQGQFSMEESLHEFSGKNHEVMTLGALTEGPWNVLSEVGMRAGGMMCAGMELCFIHVAPWCRVSNRPFVTLTCQWVVYREHLLHRACLVVL